MIQISHISFVVPIPFQAKLYQKPRDHVKLYYHLINQGFGYIEGTGYTFSPGSVLHDIVMSTF